MLKFQFTVIICKFSVLMTNYAYWSFPSSLFHTPTLAHNTLIEKIAVSRYLFFSFPKIKAGWINHCQSSLLFIPRSCLDFLVNSKIQSRQKVLFTTTLPLELPLADWIPENLAHMEMILKHYYLHCLWNIWRSTIALGLGCAIRMWPTVVWGWSEEERWQAESPGSGPRLQIVPQHQTCRFTHRKIL